jgi:hypothetical protein
LPAALEFVDAVAIAEQAEVTQALKAARQCVQ